MDSSEGFLTEQQREMLDIAPLNVEVLSSSPKSPTLKSPGAKSSSSGGGKASTAGIAVRHVRRTHSGKHIRVKKDGAGGKGTWGKLLDTDGESHLDRNDPNYDSGEKELGVTWDVDLYGELLKIGGGKERMTAYFNKVGWPENAPKTEEERKEFIAGLHKRKTELFMALIEKKLLPLRPGVQKLIDQALGNGVKVAVCSTSNEKAVSAIVSCLLGPARAEQIQIYAGDVVPRKKPDPAIYLLAASTLGVDPSSCVVVEDSGIGLAAAKAAGMKCIVTKSGYTADENFSNADAVFDCIGDPPEERFDLAFCGSLLEKQYVS